MIKNAKINHSSILHQMSLFVEFSPELNQIEVIISIVNGCKWFILFLMKFEKS